MRQKLQKRIQALEKQILVKRNVSLPASLKPNKINPVSSLSTSFSFLNQNVNSLLEESKRLRTDPPQSDIKIHSHSTDAKNSNLIGKKYFNLEHYKARVSTQNLHNLKEKLNLPKLTPTLIKYFDRSLEKKKPFFEQSEDRIKKRAYQKVEEIYQKEQKMVGERFKHIERIKTRISVLDKIYLDKQRLKKKYAQLNMG